MKKKKNKESLSGGKAYMEYLFSTYPPSMTLRDVVACEQKRMSVIKDAAKSKK